MVTTENVEIEFDAEEYKTRVHPLWCPGCGDFAILKALKNALFELQLDPSETILIAGIGCSSKMMHSVGTYGLHVIHGRALPAATGVKMGNHNLNVIAFGGDGDMLGIGGNHLLHACRRNADMTLIIPNNQTYGLTTGQASPTSDQGYETSTSPDGTVEKPLNATQIAMSAGASFVARSSSAKNEHLQEMIQKAIKHKGMAVIDVLQFCITFNKVNTPDYYEPRLYDLQETDHNVDNFEEAVMKSAQWGDDIPYGIIYQKDEMSFGDGYTQLSSPTSLAEGRTNKVRDVSKIFEDNR